MDDSHSDKINDQPGAAPEQQQRPAAFEGRLIILGHSLTRLGQSGGRLGGLPGYQLLLQGAVIQLKSH